MGKLRWWLAGLVALYALGFRVSLLGQNPFHMDEAFYASFSDRVVHGDLLVTGGLNNDKPPLQYYLGAAGLALFGKHESSVRFMECLVSAAECGLLTLALFDLAGPLLALLGGALVASSPLHAAFGATGVMDSLFSFLLFLSFYLSASGRPWSGGLAAGLSCASKQSGFFFLPLLLATTLLEGKPGREKALAWAKGLAWVLLPLLAWCLFFAHPRFGMFWLIAAGQPEVRPDFSGSLARLPLWLSMGKPLFVWPQAFLVLLIFASLGVVWLGWRWRNDPKLRPWVLAGLVPGYFLASAVFLHMRTFDRYLVPLASMMVLACGLALGEATRRKPVARWLVLPLLLAVLWSGRFVEVPPNQQGVGFRGNRGFPELAQWLDTRYPHKGQIASRDASLRWLSAFYLAPGWSVSGPGEFDPAKVQTPPLWIVHDDAPPPQIKGWNWQAAASFPAEKGEGYRPWTVYIASKR